MIATSIQFNSEIEKRLLEKIRNLPSEKIIEVEDFIDFLCDRLKDRKLSKFYDLSLSFLQIKRHFYKLHSLSFEIR